MTRDPAETRKARGAFLPPPEISDFIVQWAIRSGQDRVLEPSCGDGEFLIPAGRRLQALGAGLFAGDLITAVEIHEASVAAAQERAHRMGFRPTFASGELPSRTQSFRDLDHARLEPFGLHTW